MNPDEECFFEWLFKSTYDSYYNCWVFLGIFWILSKAPYDFKR